MSSVSPERAFLHLIADPLTIARLSASRTVEEMEKLPPCPERDQISRRLTVILKAIETIQEHHATRKEELFRLEQGPSSSSEA